MTTSGSVISVVKRYGLAVLSVAVAVAGTSLLVGSAPVTGRITPLFFLALLLSAWVGGFGPGLLAAALATLAIDYFFLPPLYSIQLDAAKLPHLLVFFVSAVIVSSWSAARKRAETALERARLELEAKVEQRTAELRRSNDQLREQAGLLDLTHDAIFVRDMTDVIRYWNQGAQAFYGWTAEETAGKTTHDLLKTVFPAPLDAINAELLRTGHWEGDLLHTRRDGATLIVASRWALQRDESGKPVVVLQTNNDVTERRQAEDALRRLNAELEQKVAERTAGLEAANRELEAFSYSVSHDLRAPLRHMAGYAELLQKQAASTLDDKSRRYLVTILDASRRMGMLIDDLLAFSRVGRAEIQKAAVKLDQVVKEAVTEVRRETEGRDIAWRIGALPEVNGDRALLRLVVVNLVANAVKFTRPRAHAEIRIEAADRGHEVVVTTADNGVGFDMKYADKLFGVFQRLHRPEEFEGTGIGLATVQRIVHRHGGRVWAEGAVDGGATFHFSIPKA
jgi:PAS domain S-box-containing protein